MEEIFTRFPHLGEQIFDQLNRKDLTKCRKVEESWRIFINRQKFPWIRVIKKHLKLDKDYNYQIGSVLQLSFQSYKGEKK